MNGGKTAWLRLRIFETTRRFGRISRRATKIWAFWALPNILIGHATKVSDTAARILEELNYDARTVELARIAGYMHDIGNCVNRTDHAHSGAIMAMTILRSIWAWMPKEIATVIAAIGNHDEKTGTAVDAVSAALILADKTDVRRNRVRGRDRTKFDIHDRVNFAAISSVLQMDQG